MRNSQKLLMPQFKVRNNFSLYFFQLSLVEQNKLDSHICNSLSHSTFKKKILNFMRPSSNEVLKVSLTKGLIFLTLIFLSGNKFKHSFLDTLNPLCICGFDIEIFNHFIFHCSRIYDERQHLLLKIEGIFPNIFIKTDNSIK